MSVNEFLKELKQSFSNFEFKATSKEGRVFKSLGYDEANHRLKLKNKKA